MTGNEKIISGGDLFALLGLAGLSLLLCSYLPDSYYIPFVLKAADPSLFANDLFVNSQSVYNSYYFVILGRLSLYVDLGVLLAALHGLFVYAAALSVFALAMTLFKERKTAYLSVLLLLIPKCAVSLALAGINLGAPEPSEFAAPFLLLAIALFLNGAYRTACLLCGFMFYFQGMAALIVSALFCFFFIVRIKKLPLPAVAAAVLFLVLPVLPLAWKMLSAGFFEFAAPGEVARWLEILKLRSWYHVFPFSWGISDWFNYSGWFLWAFIVYRYGRPSPKQETVLELIKAIGLLCALSTVFTELFPVPAVIKLVLWRSTIFFLFFLVIYISRYLIEFSARSAAAALLAACSAAAVFLGLYKLIVCFALLHLAFEAGAGGRAARLLRAAGFSGLAVFALGTLLPPAGGTPLLKKALLFSDLGFKDLAAFLAVLLFSFSAFRLYKAGRPGAARAALVFLVLSQAAAGFLWPAKDAGAGKALRRDWTAAQLWARENTPKDAVFITPPHIEGFRLHSLRGVFLELKDGAACVYSLPFSFKWWQRLEDLGYRPGERGDLAAEMERLYAGLNENEVRKLAGEYGASYFVAEAGAGFKFRELYKNGHFKIYSTGGEVFP
ncbi:MAG: hypothetical protein HY550_06865 [Elusimicrobia bacterium]|nr:hypothetical protein [Elusimicrobiota bacterium]